MSSKRRISGSSTNGRGRVQSYSARARAGAGAGAGELAQIDSHSIDMEGGGEELHRTRRRSSHLRCGRHSRPSQQSEHQHRRRRSSGSSRRRSGYEYDDVYGGGGGGGGEVYRTQDRHYDYDYDYDYDHDFDQSTLAENFTSNEERERLRRNQENQKRDPSAVPMSQASMAHNSYRRAYQHPRQAGRDRSIQQYARRVSTVRS